MKEKLYRKKPIIVKAYQTNVPLTIETLEGTMHATEGDYIITGIKGEKYPCKPDIFEQTYEPITENECDGCERDCTMCGITLENDI